MKTLRKLYEISKEITKNNEEFIKVPFKTVAYYAQLKD